MRLSREFLFLATLVMLGGCRPTFAPPVKSANFGVPGHLEGGQVEVSALGGTSSMSDTLFHGSPFLTVAVADWAALEGGGDFFAERALMGWGGLRITPLNLERSSGKRLRKLGLDLAVGGGGGIGGVICNDGYPESDGLFDKCPSGANWDGVSWDERTASGFYAEIGLGFRFGRRFGLVFRPNFQMTTADGIPRTNWFDLVFGIHIRISKHVRGHLTTSYYIYNNAWDSWLAVVSDLGFSVVLGRVKDLDGKDSSPRVSILPASGQSDLW